MAEVDRAITVFSTQTRLAGRNGAGPAWAYAGDIDILPAGGMRTNGPNAGLRASLLLTEVVVFNEHARR